MSHALTSPSCAFSTSAFVTANSHNLSIRAISRCVGGLHPHNATTTGFSSTSLRHFRTVLTVTPTARATSSVFAPAASRLSANPRAPAGAGCRLVFVRVVCFRALRAIAPPSASLESAPGRPPQMEQAAPPSRRCPLYYTTRCQAFSAKSQQLPSFLWWRKWPISPRFAKTAPGTSLVPPLDCGTSACPPAVWRVPLSHPAPARAPPFAPKGQKIAAQGTTLGNRAWKRQALKGRYRPRRFHPVHFTFCRPPLPFPRGARFTLSRVEGQCAQSVPVGRAGPSPFCRPALPALSIVEGSEVEGAGMSSAASPPFAPKGQKIAAQGSALGQRRAETPSPEGALQTCLLPAFGPPSPNLERGIGGEDTSTLSISPSAAAPPYPSPAPSPSSSNPTSLRNSGSSRIPAKSSSVFVPSVDLSASGGLVPKPNPPNPRLLPLPEAGQPPPRVPSSP